MKTESTVVAQQSPGSTGLTVPREELRRGARGPAVVMLQRILVVLQHLPAGTPGATDGDFGPKTEEGLKACQASLGLPADGLYGPGMYEPLARRLASCAPASAGGISLEDLLAIMPRLQKKHDLAVQCLPFLNAAMSEAEIYTPPRRAAFLAQLAHESGELRYFEELASGEAYEGRKDLGNTQPGDGPRYKGRGPIQLTGRANYRRAGQALGVDLEGSPQRAADPDVGFRVACWFWKTHHLNELADAGDFDAITKRINGGLNGKADRDACYQRALGALHAQAPGKLG